MTVLIILIAPRAGALTDRVGSRWLVGGGMTLLAVMLFYYSHARRERDLLGLLPGAAARRGRDGHDDDAGDGGGDERRAGRQGGRRLGRAELRPAGRRLARDRGHGRRSSPAPPATSTRLPRRAARRRASSASSARRSRWSPIRKVEHPQRGGRARDARVEAGMTQAPAKRLTAEARRQAVLDTACRVFSRSSYRGATTAEIAREAGITEPILYRHFGSKRDLYLACLDEAWASSARSPSEAIARGPGQLPRRDRRRLHGEAVAKIRLIDLWIQALDEASEDAVIAKAVEAPDPRGARLLRRRDPRRPGSAASSTPTATRSPRRGSSSPAACSRRSTTGSAACSATTSSACAPSAGAGCAPLGSQRAPEHGEAPAAAPGALSLVRRGALGVLRCIRLCGPAAPPGCVAFGAPSLHLAWRQASVQGGLTVRAMSGSVK